MNTPRREKYSQGLGLAFASPRVLTLLPYGGASSESPTEERFRWGASPYGFMPRGSALGVTWPPRLTYPFDKDSYCAYSLTLGLIRTLNVRKP